MPKKEQTYFMGTKKTEGARSKEQLALEPEILTKHGYRVLGRVGKGSFADVRMAFSSSQKRNIAVKIILKHKILDKELLKRFIPREIKVLRQLNHPNIIKFYRCIETVRTIYIFMELAENGDLLQVIKREKKIDEQRACRWFHHIVDGLAYLHSKGIVHRDLKCENLLLDRYNIIKLTDFGFTRDGMPVYLVGDKENKEREVILSSTFCGSFAYASPEVLLGKPYEPHMSDVWSIGVVLYITVFGRLPFDDTDWNGLLKQVRENVQFPAMPKVADSCKELIQGILAPLGVRWYIPEIRADEWYNRMWDSKYESLYQRKHQWEKKERESSKRLDQHVYMGRKKDITKYERVATLRRYISEKERLRIIKAQLVEEEAKLRNLNDNTDINKSDRISSQQNISQNGIEISSDKETKQHSHESKDFEMNNQLIGETSKNCQTIEAPQEQKEIEPVLISVHVPILESKCLSDKTFTPDETIDRENVYNSTNIRCKSQTIYLDGEQKMLQSVGESKVSNRQQASNPDLPLSEPDMPGLMADNKISKTTSVSSSADEIEQSAKIAHQVDNKSVKYFKDVNEAILEYNKPVQQSSFPLRSVSRAKEISSQRFCRTSIQRINSQSEDFRNKEKNSDQLMMENWKLLEEELPSGSTKFLDSEYDEETNLVIENFEMPQTLIEGGFQEVELSVHGSLSNISIAQLINDIEQDIKEDENNAESKDLIARYKCILEEDKVDNQDPNKTN